MSLAGVPKDAIRLELLRRAGRKDPAGFASKLFARSGRTLAPYQARLLQSGARYVMLNCSRQAGKSTAAAVLCLWQALFFPNSLIVVFGTVGRQANEILVKVQEFIDLLPERPDLKGDSVNKLAFKNGSRIIALPSTQRNIRGFAAQLVIMDEASEAPDSLFRAVAPMIIASKGRLVIMSTPAGQRGFFHSLWSQALKGWDLIEAPWQQVPWHDPADIAMQRTMLQELFAQEFECQFLAAGIGNLYSAFNVAVNVIPALPPADPKLWSWLLGLDFGVINATAFVVAGWLPQDPTLYIAHSESAPGLLASQMAERITTLQRAYPFYKITGDEGGMGKGFAEELRKHFLIPAEAADKQRKAAFINVLNGSFALGRVKIVGPTNEDLVHQVRVLQWDKHRKNHRPGQPADLADAFLYAWRSSTAYLQDAPPSPLSKEERIRKETADFWDRAERENRGGTQDDLWGQDSFTQPYAFEDD